MAEFIWKQKIFVPEDFDGAGQYIIRETINKTNYSHVKDTGYLSTIMYKIGYIHGGKDMDRTNSLKNYYCLISMSDGLIKTGYFITQKNGKKLENSSDWIWSSFSDEESYLAKQKICDFLNQNPHEETYRFATNEELVRVALYQKSRTR